MGTSISIILYLIVYSCYIFSLAFVLYMNYIDVTNLFKPIHYESIARMIQHALKRMIQVERDDRYSIYTEYKDMFKGIDRKETNFMYYI